MRIRINYPLTAKEIHSVFNNDIEPIQDEIFNFITTDSREVAKGDIFFSLSGDAEAAERYILEAKKAGALTVGNSLFSDITVDDTRTALIKLSAYYARKLPKLKKIIAITGSIGKSTTKEITRNLLSAWYKTHATEKNYNNALGVSYTVFSTAADTEMLVLEIGMNHSGEIREIAKYLKPDIAIITNIASAHIGNLGSKQAIAKAKLEICEYMDGDGITLVPAGEELLEGAYGRATASIDDPTADYFLIPLQIGKTESIFDFYSKKIILTDERISIPGKHILQDALYAISIAVILGIPKKAISDALAKMSIDLIKQRITEIGKYKILDDTYSSSPEAVIAMLDQLKLLGTKKTGALLGDMLELGEKTEQMHKEIGKAAYLSGVEKLYLFGKYSAFTAIGAIEAGMNPKNLFINTDPENPQATASAISKSYSGELILAKASRKARLERIFDYLNSEK